MKRKNLAFPAGRHDDQVDAITQALACEYVAGPSVVDFWFWTDMDRTCGTPVPVCNSTAALDAAVQHIGADGVDGCCSHRRRNAR